jgi:SulP family sulfate permease
MVNVGEFKTIARISRADFLVLGATMALTVLTDLVFAVEVGMVLSVFLLFVHFANSADISTSKDYQQTSEINAALASHPTLRDKVGVYTVNGPFFFGAMSVFEKKLNEHMQMAKPVIILRMKEVPFIDSTGVVRLKEFIHRRIKAKGAVLISGLQPWVRDKLQADAEFRKLIPGEHLFARTKEALAYAERLVAESRPKDAAKSLQKTLELA